MLRLAWLAWLCMVLAGCGVLGRGKPVAGQPTVERFEMTGRVAVRYEGDGYTGTLRWRHTESRDSVDLYGPIGTLYARLERDAAGATLVTADGKRFADADAGALSQRVLGWELPLEQLPFWLFSRPAPGSTPERHEHSPQGRTTQLMQDGWNVRYRSYFETLEPLLPERVELDRPGLKVKLIVSRWTEGPGAKP